ncbi:hypothetical protein M432DRAFT_458554 [Thermoascus aurantiacus ATCC 26904]
MHACLPASISRVRMHGNIELPNLLQFPRLGILYSMWILSCLMYWRSKHGHSETLFSGSICIELTTAILVIPRTRVRNKTCVPTDPGDHGRKNAEMDILGYSRSELSTLRQRYVPFPVFVYVQYLDAYQYIVNGPKVTNVPHIRTSYASGDILMCGAEEASMLLRCYVRSYPSLYCTADRRHGPVRFPLMSEEMMFQGWHRPRIDKERQTWKTVANQGAERRSVRCISPVFGMLWNTYMHMEIVRISACLFRWRPRADMAILQARQSGLVCPRLPGQELLVLCLR